ncbi:hypothetical protein AUEXF2481DRAFT_39673 [Aureobasidium subglaciale EXF-2481]|uniref:DUF1275 domain protein n=1 Tax=Aureobasidium subglaciale (strain EXF-2481) TaxID=1043005 RepID=A0A074YDD4_AURSE|nr:uncharacterized protein AUEXF2481DRAFT_39673 [Aureobasidium subglaciale EXF-2481]KEQ95818.1 hypothetical protein AUEXF2481DRAFT_39673 [Aureobasidium subglaciale EXF-2481]
MPQEAKATADDTSPPRKASSEALDVKKPGFFSTRRILGPVDKEFGDYALLVHSFVTGLVDAASFANWGVFVGMQTGNTVILGLSTAGLPDNPHAWTTTLVSLASFLAGAFLTFRSTSLVSPKGVTSNRLWLSTIFFIQAALIIISAALVSADLVPHNRTGYPDDEHKRGVIGNILIVSLFPPLGFQSGMQIATSRLLGYNELPVNVLTSTYCDLMGDAKLFALHNVKRNRRAIAVVLLFVGAIISGWLLRSSGGLQSVLWLAAGIKLLVAVFTFTLHPAKMD